MKRFLRKAAALTLSTLLLLGVIAPALASGASESTDAVTILFTHDTHSHFLPAASDDGGEYGGFTRLATLLKQQRAAASNPTITLDGGDFSMGTLFQTVYATEAAELRMLGALGYDATTFGNHEYDYRSAGLASMLNAALDSGDPLPAIVQANYLPPAEGEEGYDADAQAVRDALDAYGVRDYVMIEKEGVRFAVFGVLGVDADSCAPMSGMVYEDEIEAAAQVVAEIQENETYDYIVCLSHSGTSSGKGEDYELAKAVDGIDVIISGHTHSTLTAPIEVNGALIVSCGEYTTNLGVLSLAKNADGETVMTDYQLIPVDETVSDDADAAALVESFKETVNEEYLADYGYTFDQVLTTSPFHFTSISTFASTQAEDTLGNLISDSYVYAVQQAEGEDYENVDFAVVGSGVIRGSFAAGPITVADAYNVSSLGSGADGTPGYPLIAVYILGKELKDCFEVDASVSSLMSGTQLYGSGMNWSFNTHRMLFDKITDCYQVLPDGTTAELVDDQLYRVVTGLYSGQMLGAVNSKSFGLLTVTPRDAQGNEITDFEACIIHNPDGTELKEWYALASYLDSMDTVDARYSAPEGRKLVSASWNPVELLSHPGWITLVALAVILLVLALVVFIIYRIATHGRRKGKRKGSSYAPYRGK